MNFSHWLRNRLRGPDKIMALIRAAGPSGVREGDLRSAAELPRKMFDRLLQALVEAGVIQVVERGGVRFVIGR